MNCEDVPMSEWDKLTGAEQEVLEYSIPFSWLMEPRDVVDIIKPLIDGEGRPLA